MQRSAPFLYLHKNWRSSLQNGANSAGFNNGGYMVIKKRNVFTINSTVRLIEILMAIPLLVACGDENGNQSQSPEMPQREVVSYDELGYCTTDREGDSIFVASQSTDYLCINNNWIDITNVQISSSFGVNPVYSSSGIETITSSSSIFFFSSSEINNSTLHQA